MRCREWLWRIVFYRLSLLLGGFERACIDGTWDASTNCKKVHRLRGEPAQQS